MSIFSFLFFIVLAIVSIIATMIVVIVVIVVVIVTIVVVVVIIVAIIIWRISLIFTLFFIFIWLALLPFISFIERILILVLSLYVLFETFDKFFLLFFTLNEPKLLKILTLLINQAFVNLEWCLFCFASDAYLSLLKSFKHIFNTCKSSYQSLGQIFYLLVLPEDIPFLGTHEILQFIDDGLPICVDEVFYIIILQSLSVHVSLI